MKEVYEIISRIDRALGDSMEKYFTDQGFATGALWGAILSAKTLAKNSTVVLSVHEAVALINNINAACKHLMLMKCPELALEAFSVEYRLSERVDPDSAESDALFATLKEKLDDLFTVAWNAKQQEPFIDAALPAKLGFTPAAMALKSHLYTLKAQTLMRKNEADAALFCLMEAYSDLADSVSQSDMNLDDTRLKLLRNIRRCLDAKGDRRLARWLQHKMDVIKARNGEQLDTPVKYRPEGSLPSVREGWPCAAFAMQDAQAAYDHLRDYKVVQHYGDGKQGHWFHTWDDGYRHLGVCPKCHGFILVQRSEYHGEEDSYYGDYFPVSGPAEADEVNEKYDGWEIEEHFPGRYLIENGGPASWYDIHLREKAEKEKPHQES